MSEEISMTQQDGRPLLTDADFNRMFLRCLTYGFSWNYERMQNLCFLYVLIPALKKIYANDSKEEMGIALTRHMEFFNTHQTAAPFIAGITAALEEKEKNSGAAAISGIKVGLMGPLAGLGDSLFWLTFVPICFSIGASYSQGGSLLGVALALALVNVVNLSLKYFGLKFGYKGGMKFISNAVENGTLDKITDCATGLGLILVGGLIPQMVSAKLGLEFASGELVVNLQSILDGIVPGLLPLLLTLLMCYLVRKGKKPAVLIFLVLIIGVVLYAAGIIA